uniref:Upstream stimulatory factor 1 n=1 Tax=Pavo cristatus TaxID=9049 RepID=A0A8C9LB27_PAVCR
MGFGDIAVRGHGECGGKYVFGTENSGMVIQVADGQLDGQTEGTSAISGYPATQSMTQAVIQGAFTSDDAVETEATATETHYTYFPTAAVADTSTSAGAGTTATAVVTTQNSEALLGQPTPTGQFFVMMSPQEVLQGGTQRSIAPRAHPYSPKAEAPRATRDEKRRAQHNEVERRRRDKINNWIVQLSKIIPDCSMENTKSGPPSMGLCIYGIPYLLGSCVIGVQHPLGPLIIEVPHPGGLTQWDPPSMGCHFIGVPCL